MKPKMKMVRWLGLAGLLALGAEAVSPAELDALLQSSTKVTLIDVRDESMFRHGHIPNAINVPERVLALKKLPPLGFVVVYGQGFGEDLSGAVDILNEKPGIKAEALDGGYAAWQTRKGRTTQATGFQKEALNVITYQNLQDLDTTDEVVLVDLRKEPEPEATSGIQARQADALPAPTLTPLAEKFPGKTVVKSPFEVAGVAGSGHQGRQADAVGREAPLMVLIDNGDGEAQKMARILKANGVHRVVILAGGEKILERDGAAGLQRLGMGSQELEMNNE
ncbi:hypothetical protein PDESU_04639 [Pontiella desulfatans]|uniref:Rhodanese domain-containing protein n=1 Tax=Pontiella desulfatans TaxID=2750659 RepID=A0A6C2U846_PONDE|nr:rhodanese-like domain-containing protein [Pontiella desulfatans]VGO16049.1 hypothetical protein PDESU_04639 [Pontiella desulfatans]